MKLVGINLWMMGTLLLLAQAQDLQQERKVIYLAEVSCKTFVEETKREQGIIVAWLEGYYLPDNDPPAIDVDKLVSDTAKLIEHCINRSGEDLLTAADAVLGNR